MTALIYIGLGGALGSLARYAMQGWVQGCARGALFPLGTLAVNLVGSCALGFLLKLGTATAAISPDVRAGLAVGFMGAFTTMSTFSYETMMLIGEGDYWRAGLYGVGTVIGCLTAVLIGTRLGNALL